MLDLNTLKKAIYWPELLWDNTVQALNAGTSLQQPLVNLTDFSKANLLLNLVNVATTQQSGVQLNVTADNAVTYPILTSMRPAGLPGPGTWTAYKQLVATLYNASNPPTNYTTQADYGMWVFPLNDALRYLFDVPPAGLTRDQVGARLPANLRELVDDGLRPLTGPEVLRREDMVWSYQEVTLALPVNANQRTTVYSKRVPPGRAYALAYMTIDPTCAGTLTTLAAQQAAAEQLFISRDDQPDYLSPLVAGVNAQRQIQVWIPAVQTLTIELQAAQNIAAAPVVLVVADMPLSTLNAIRWYQATGAVRTQGNAKLWDVVMAGGY
jgi:hypothetical protein